MQCTMYHLWCSFGVLTFINQLCDRPSGDLSGAGSVNVIPDGVIVHTPAPARQLRQGEARSAPDKGRHGVQVDMGLGVTRHQLLKMVTNIILNTTDWFRENRELASSVATLLTSSQRGKRPDSVRLFMILSNRPGDSGCRLSSPHRQLCFNITGSSATPVFFIEHEVGEIEVPRYTKGLERVREIGLARPREMFSVEEWRALLG